VTLDFNDAPEQREFDLIPKGTVATLRITLRPGGAGDGGWLKRSADGGWRLPIQDWSREQMVGFLLQASRWSLRQAQILGEPGRRWHYRRPRELRARSRAYHCHHWTSLRGSLATAPMFIVRAHTPGTGKSYLAAAT